ncbi:rab-GTPase-TBC domain-containing protein [Trichoderma breve]|uniref:Rab-GTPase-TBC domain-containing protein n=1 Tax=Trichoderma breve TaxID=2034170 RepID=A0A9W9BAG4_9HYPO|nr:rab-GTPase-TBC domain-containing protein [Trichoderma breve]KAJ4858917.1 rab-GTPase-TBC domain-containing protein [Trichoderma breve]
MRSLAETQARWQATQTHCASVEDLQNAVRHNGPSSPCLSGCRSVCWKVFLLSKDGDSTKPSWSQSLREKRESYSERRDHFLKFINHPEALTELTIDPLADDPKSPWNTVREDEVVRAEILQDVQRLPDEANYHEDYMQRMILDILFVYCKVNPDRGGYRQGMHELLAPILHVVEQDALDRVSTTASDDEDSLEELMLETIDQSFIEHDAFILFSELMENAQSFYEVKDVPNSSPPTDGPSQSRFPEQSSAIVERSKFIHEVCLQKIDPELAAHLTSIEILPQIFLIRWIRLLFSREFPFNQFLVLWDTILAVDPSLDLIDLVCCAMLLRIRWQLLESDYSVCLQLLLKYPPPDQLHGPHTFVDDALYLRDHMNAPGGATLIKKYSGRLPNVQKSTQSTERVNSPLPGLDSIRKKGFGLRSPIRSPSKFLQQQGGVENMIQGVLEKSEKLGINQALRDAVGEIKRNMQGLNEGLSSPYPRVVLADDGAAKALAVMQRRNDQLAGLLEETVMSLRALSVSNLEDKARSLDIIEVAAAKVQFVQIYLQDASMDIPTADSSTSEEAQLAAEKREDKEIKKAPPFEKENQPLSPKSEEIQDPLSNAAEATSIDSKKEEVLSEGQPKTPVAVSIPARSTIAQSSFSWMLEPEESGPLQTPPIGKSPTSQQKRRNNNASREKNAFLFGEAPAELDERDPLRSGDIFGMEPMPTPPAKGK